MKIRKVRQILKSLADDTRLRIVNLLNKRELAVSDLCKLINKPQSNISKHLTRLRLTGVVVDRRKGLHVYYSLIRPEDKAYKSLLGCITVGLADLEIFKQDLDRLKHFKNNTNKIT